MYIAPSRGHILLSVDLPFKLSVKARSHRQNFAGAFLERWKKFITARYRSPPFNRSWPPLRQRRIRSATADGPSYRSESFELHKILRAVRSGQFSAPAKFTTAPTTPSQSLAPLDASSWTLGSARPTQKSWTLDHRCFASFARAVIKRCTNFGGAVVSVFTSGHGIAGTVSGVEAAIHCGDELWFGVGMGGVGAGPEFGYKYGEKWTRSHLESSQRPHAQNAALSTLASPLNQRSLPLNQR